MSAVVFSVHRRDLVWAVALIVLLSAVWVAKSDIADAGGSPPGEGIAVVYVAVGTNYPDALGVGPGAGADSAPIIILPTNPPIPGASSAELVRLDPRTVIIIGGTSAISDAMEDALIALLPNAVISRISGNNRYETNAAFSAATFPVEGWASIPAAAFTGSNPESDVVVIGTGAWNSSGGDLIAAIQLPHGAEILELKVDAYDTDNDENLVVYLNVVPNTGSVGPVTSVGTSGGAGLQTVVENIILEGGEIVNNEIYTYIIQVEGATGEPRQIINVMVHYRLGTSNG